MSSGDTGKETSRTETKASNRTDGRIGIGSDAVTRLCGEKYEIDSKNVIFADTILYVVRIIVPLPFLSSRIPNTDTFVDQGDSLLKPGDKS